MKRKNNIRNMSAIVTTSGISTSLPALISVKQKYKKN